jgi:hypothetical protein
VDTRKKIKELIEELNYRTDHKSSEEIYNLSRELFELSVLEHRGISTDNSAPAPAPEVSTPIEEAPDSPSRTDKTKDESRIGEELLEPEIAEEKPEEDSEENRSMDSPPNEIAEPMESDPLEETPSVETPPSTSHKSLNDVLGKTLNIGFNDRFAFVNKLFDGNQDDYNRVISQLNTMKSFVEARNFIEAIVKPDYNWGDSEEYEVRFMEILERHFD